LHNSGTAIVLFEFLRVCPQAGLVPFSETAGGASWLFFC
jgi:hypothetical protein